MHRKKILPSGGILLGVVLASLVSPHGIEGLIEPFFIFEDYGYSIVENQNVFFLNSWISSWYILLFEVLGILYLVLFLMAGVRKNLFWLLIGGFTLVATFVMVRNMPLFVIASMPMYGYLLKRVWAKIEIEPAMRRTFVGSLMVGLSIFLLIGLLSKSKSEGWKMFYFESMQGAADYLEGNKVRGEMFNNFDVGSYLIYRFYPERKVFVDGRPEAYSGEFFEVYKRMQEDSDYFDRQVEQYDIGYVVFSTTDITPWARSFLSTITRKEGWSVVYQDLYGVVLERDFE